MFTYCGNDPVNCGDPTGMAKIKFTDRMISQMANLILKSAQSLAKSIKKVPTPGPYRPNLPKDNGGSKNRSSDSSSSASSSSPRNPKQISTPIKQYAATVYAEAAGQNRKSKQAVAHTINNRVILGHWTEPKSIQEAISYPDQYNGYESAKYKDAMSYYDTGVWANSIDQAAMDESLDVVIPIYEGSESDMTGGAIYFHSFEEASDWPFHDDYTQIYVSGTEVFWFYK